MKEYKYIILGAGASGLSLAVSLLRKGETSFIVLEKEKEAGGLCRSVDVDGGPLDFGGHILDLKRKKVLDFVFSFLPEDEWKIIKRENTVKLKNGEEIGYPVESNIWQLSEEEQKKFLQSISEAGCQNGEEMPEKFGDWVKWKFGDKIAEEYMLPYNKKLWQMNLDEIGTYWLYKLPNVSYEETVESCEKKKPLGSMPAHSYFYYPKEYGYGEVFLRMEKYLEDHIVTDYEVKSIDYENRTVNGEYKGEKIISSLPWHEICADFPDEIKKEIEKLKYVSVDIDYYEETHDGHTQLTYFASPDLPYHRKIYRSTFLDRENLKGSWTEANSKIGVKQGKEVLTLKYAYPVNTVDKRETVEKIKKWAEKYNIISYGRWGDWEHMNSDVAIEKGMELAKELVGE